MKQLYTLCIALVIAQTAYAQIIDRSNFLTGPDSSYIFQELEVSETPPQGGEGQTWNYSLSAIISAPSAYQLKSVISHPSFPTATAIQSGGYLPFASYQIPVVIYIEVNNNGMFELGYAVDSTYIKLDDAGNNIIIPYQAAVYSSPMSIITFPLQYGQSQHKESPAISLAFRLTYVPFYTNVPGDYSVTLDVMKDVAGSGTLMLPGFSAPFDVVVTKEDRKLYDTIKINGQPAPALLLQQFGLKQGLRSERIVHKFWAPGNGDNIMVMEEGTTGTITSASYMTNARADVTTVEESLVSAPGQLPNVSNGRLSLVLQKSSAQPWTLTVYDMLGQVVSAGQVNGTGVRTDVLLPVSLVNGLYCYSVQDEYGAGVARGSFLLSRR